MMHFLTNVKVRTHVYAASADHKISIRIAILQDGKLKI